MIMTTSTPAIHPTAIIAEGAVLGDAVSIGPWCVIGPHVRLGDGVTLHSHVVIDGRTSLGEGCEVFPFACLGKLPQHLKYDGEPSVLEIGSRCIIREHVTMHPGTAVGIMKTVVGNDGLFLVGCHVAHDCIIGDGVVMTNQVALGGHVEIGDFAYIGGCAAIHQFVRIGRHAVVGGMSAVAADVIPYGSAMGNRCHLVGLNLVGLKRRAFSKDQISTLRQAYRMLFAFEGTFSERLEEVERIYGEDAGVADIIGFIREQSGRALCQPERG